MKNIYSQLIVGLFFIAILSQCAQLGVPSGGDEDKDPPAVVKTIPENESINFSGEQLKITFDEFVSLNDINNQLIISPPLVERPDISLKKKTLTIEFKEALRDNTTYSVNFGEGIKDYNVGNVLRNFTLAFSTGAVLDSMKVSGRVFDAKTTLVKEKVKVMLYDQLEDSLPSTVKPIYFAQTDTEGNFEINYLSPGQYKLFALEEIDGNFLYDNADENIAFLKEAIVLNDEISVVDSMRLDVFNEEKELGYITKSLSDSLSIEKVVFNTPQKGMGIHQVIKGDSIPLLSYLGSTKDTITYFLRDSSEVFISRLDGRFMSSEVLIDTLIPKFYSSNYSSAIGKKITLLSKSSKRLTPGDELIIRSSVPFLDIDTSLIHIGLNDSLEVGEFSIAKLDTFSFRLDMKLKASDKYKLEFLPDAVTSNYGSLTDTTSFNYRVLAEKELGELSFTVNLPFEHPVLIFKNKKGDEVRKIRVAKNEKIILNHLFPDELEVYCLNDVDQDMQWTTGRYEDNRQPEKIVKFPQKIEVRANWSQDFVWE